MTGRDRRASRVVDTSVRIVTGIVPNTRSFAWAVKQTRSIRHKVKESGVNAKADGPLFAGPRGSWGVRSGIALSRPTCLERALVLQAWLGSYSDAPDVVIGVRRRHGKVQAHAWIDGHDPWYDPSYQELTRLQA